MNGADTKVCPACAETIKVAAKVCPHCRSWQKIWSWRNPQVQVGIAVLIWLGISSFVGTVVERMFGPGREFSYYRDEIGVVSSESSHRVAGSNEWVTVVGTLTNRSNIGWKDVSVEAQFVDKSGKLIDVIPAPAGPYNGPAVLPHGVAAFKVEGRAAQPLSEYDKCKVTVRWARDANSFL